MAKLFQRIIFISAASAVLALSGCTTMDGHKGPDKAVYHINDSANATALMRNATNHMDTDPTAKIVVVTHAQGVDFLMNDAKDKDGNPYNVRVEALKAKGVKFEVCEITLKSRKLNKSQFIPEASYVPSGVVEVTKLQSREGYSYVKP